MSLEAGQKLAHYEVVEPIGKGGMGEVYRAKDSKLGRDVAIKVLPDELARDEERLRRFQREAKVLASLNHPNIAAIYGLEQSANTHFLVLELVPGETLAERIARGPILFDEALSIARQIAEALEDAHEHGIVHRDLKPANVKLTEDGKVKVLDFGLAKAFFDEATEVDSSLSPTITRDATRIGVILGTAAYMSPEQAKGKQVDRRADVWAFGVVVYEMLTAKRAFAAEDVSETLAFVLTRELDWTALPPDTPASIRRLLRRCLTRDRRKRLAEMTTALLELDEANEAPEVSASAPIADLALWQRPAGVAIVASVALVIGALVWGLVRPSSSPGPRPITRLGISLPEGERFTNTGRHMVAAALDGSYIVYSAEQALWIRRLDELTATRITGSDGGREPFVSPDGRWIGFWSPDQLKKVAATGGAPIVLCEAENPYGATWGEDDTLLFGQRDGIWRVPAAGGTPERVIEVGAGERVHGPQRLPGNEWVLFTVSTATWENAQIVVQSLRTGKRESLIDGGRDARYSLTGHLVYASNGVLFGVAFDAERRTVLGGPVSLVEGVRTAGPTGAVHFSLSNDGSLVYWPGRVGSDSPRGLVRVDRSGNREVVPMQGGPYLGISLSPDGSKVALGTESAENTDVWVVELDRGSVSRVTTEASSDALPLWSPDGQSVVFESHRDGVPALYRKAGDGTGDAERLFALDGSTQITPEDWTPDGTQLLVTIETQDGNRDIGLLPWNPPGDWEPLIHSGASEYEPALSPNGHWIAYTSEDTGRWEVYVQRFPELGGRRPVSIGGGFAPAWSSDGTELFYLRAPIGPTEAMMRVAIERNRDGTTLTPGRPEELFEWSFFDRDRYYRRYEPSPDGRFLLLAEMADAGTPASPYDLVVVQNWTQELRERVPVP